MRRNVSNYGQQVLILLLFFVGMMLISSCLTLVLSLFGLDMASSTNLLIVQGLTQVMSFVVPPVALALMFKHNQKDMFQLDFGLNKWGKGLIGILILVLAMPIIDWMTQWNGSLHFENEAWTAIEAAIKSMEEQLSETMNNLLYAESMGKLMLNLVVIALVPAICEELFFRGSLQQLLHGWMGNAHVAIWVTAAVFSLAHGDIMAFLPRFALGVMLGYLFYYGGSIVVNSMVHFVNNAMVVVLYYLNQQGISDFSPDEPLNVMWQWTALFTVAAVAMIYVNFAMGNKPESKWLKNEKNGSETMNLDV